MASKYLYDSGTPYELGRLNDRIDKLTEEMRLIRMALETIVNERN